MWVRGPTKKAAHPGIVCVAPASVVCRSITLYWAKVHSALVLTKSDTGSGEHVTEEDAEKIRDFKAASTLSGSCRVVVLATSSRTLEGSPHCAPIPGKRAGRHLPNTEMQ